MASQYIQTATLSTHYLSISRPVFKGRTSPSQHCHSTRVNLTTHLPYPIFIHHQTREETGAQLWLHRLSQHKCWLDVQTLPDDAQMPGWHCSAVSDSTLDTSRWDCITTASSFGCQPSTDSSATSKGHIRWSGVRCRRSVDVQLSAKTSTQPFLQCFCYRPSS